MIGDCGPFNHRDKEAAILKSSLFIQASLLVYKVDGGHIYPEIDV